MINCTDCKRPLEGLRSPISGKYLGHIHDTIESADYAGPTLATVGASLALAFLPFYMLAMGWL